MFHIQKKKRARRRHTEYISDGGDYGEDRISELPDEILISILSRLTLREAADTSVLSRRWRHLWTYTSRLNFDSKVNKIVRQSYPLTTVSTAERQREYIEWVDKVLAKYRGGRNLDEFRVCFDLCKKSRYDMDKWFEFVMSKNVKNLEFDLRCSFQSQELGLREAWDPPMNMNPNCMFVGFKSLKTLSLKSINVSGEAVEYLLSNSPLLERLSVHGSSSLVNLKFGGRSIMLRHLEIVECSSIQAIEICDTNLVSFTYRGDRGDVLSNIPIKNAPLLVEVLIGVGKLGFPRSMVSKFMWCAHQVQIIQLTLYYFMPEHLGASLMLSKLRNLKQLELILFVGSLEDCLLRFVAMLKQCPRLESFVLQLKRRIIIIPVTESYAKELIKYSHEHLKVVKIVGFDGSRGDCDLVMQIIENAIALEKIIIDTNQGYGRREKWLMKRELAARTRAMRLKSRVASSLKFIVL